MADSQRQRLIHELKRIHPRMRKTDDIADVLIVGKKLNAINEINPKKKWNFVLNGINSNAFYRAYRYQLLDKQKSVRRAFVMSMRGIRPRNKHETRNALHQEKLGLFRHLAASITARNAVAYILSLPTNNFSAIRRMLDQGTVEKQLGTYSKVVTHLTLKNLYNKRFDYYWMGFRFIADKYWLSKSALRLIAKVT